MSTLTIVKNGDHRQTKYTYGLDFCSVFRRQYSPSEQSELMKGTTCSGMLCHARSVGLKILYIQRGEKVGENYCPFLRAAL